jgi:hypothetical protein
MAVFSQKVWKCGGFLVTLWHETDIRTKEQKKCAETLDKDIGEVYGAH